MTDEVFFSLNSCNLAFGKKVILEEASISVHNNDKVALVGKNGVGKSTLLNIINGSKEIDSGDIWFNKNVKTCLLNQGLIRGDNISAFDFLSKIFDSDTEEYNVDYICNQLKLNKNELIKNMSGGMLRKLSLASLILGKPQFFLLDEPTNHLDIESIQWLENYLINDFKGAFIVISHNRSFLKNVTNKVFWMDRKKLRVSPKGFNDFELWSRSLINQEKRELENKKRFLSEEVEWLSKGVTARRKRNVRRKENILNFRIEYEKQRSEFLKSITKTKILPPEKNEKGPNLLINFHNIRKIFQKKNETKTIIENFNYKFTRGQKIGILGKNGSGKSTFLNMIKNPEMVDEGNIKIRKNVDFSFFDQSGSQLYYNKSIKENMIPGGGDYIEVANKKIHICGYLKNFLFEPKIIDKKVGLLSGGERNRLLLAKVLSNPKEILILDEPTNDLDIETIDILIEFLKNFNGGVIVASHDMDFLDKISNKFFFFNDSANVKISYERESFLNTFDEEKKPKTQENNLDIVNQHKKKKPDNIDKLIKKILTKIDKKEKELKELSMTLENKKNLQYSVNEDLINQITQTQRIIKELEKEWFELEEKSISRINTE